MSKYQNSCLTSVACAVAMMLLPYTAVAQQPPADERATESGEEILEEVVVRGLRWQQQTATAIERSSTQIKSVITADDAGQFADSNIGEALTRLPGVTIDTSEGEGRFIVVRGISSNFVQVTVNGATLGSSSGVGNSPNQNRAVALNVIPTELLQRVDVEKSLLPNVDHDSFGARVNLRPLSAFDRKGKTTFSTAIEADYSDNADKARPKISANATHRMPVGNNGTEFGIAAAINYDEREVFSSGVVTDHDRLAVFNPATGEFEVQDPRFVGLGTDFIYPTELDYRTDLGHRERTGGTLTFDLENDRHDLFASILYGRLQDNDLRSQYEVELGIRRPSDLEELGPGRLVTNRMRLEPQFFDQTNREDTLAVHFDGTSRLTDNLSLSYGIDHSDNDFEQIGSRIRFRSPRNQTEALYGASGADTNYNLTDDPVTLTPADIPSNQYLRNQTFFTDEISSVRAQLDYDFQLFEKNTTFSIGGKFRDRTRDIHRAGANQGGGPNSFINANPNLPASFADIETSVVDSPLNVAGNLPFGFLSPSLDSLRSLLAEFEETFDLASRQITTYEYTIDEETTSFFAMADVELSQNLDVLFGVRYEETDYFTAGSSVRRHRLDTPTDQIEGEAPLSSEPGVLFNYSDWFPHVHLRWEPTDTTLFRASYYQSHVRPGFGAARGEQSLFIRGPIADASSPPSAVVEMDLDQDGTTELIDTSSLGYWVRVEGGNPMLRPTTADQVDLQFGWYPNESFDFTASFFYKDIKNQVTVVGADDSSPEGIALIDALSPIKTDVATGQPTTEFVAAVNGQSAELYGLEMSANYYLTDLPGIWSGLFLSGNISFIDSKQRSDVVRSSEETRLPDQSDLLWNASVGYEDDRFLFRVSASHRGEQALGYNAQFPSLDLVRADFTRVDFVGRYRITDRVRAFVKVNNLFGATEENFVVGNANSGGAIFNAYEDFGTRINLGVNVNFSAR